MPPIRYTDHVESWSRYIPSLGRVYRPQEPNDEFLFLLLLIIIIKNIAWSTWTQYRYFPIGWTRRGKKNTPVPYSRLPIRTMINLPDSLLRVIPYESLSPKLNQFTFHQLAKLENQRAFHVDPEYRVLSEYGST